MTSGLIYQPVLFLDFDDVICLNKTCGGYDVLLAISQVKNGQSASLDGGEFRDLWAQLFDADAKAHLHLLHKEFSPSYVLSTSWRKFMDKDSFVAVLRRSGLGFVADNLHPDWKTPTEFSAPDRAREISHWLSRHPDVEGRWVVLDDELSGTGFAHWPSPELMPYLVFCKESVGITAIEFEKLREAFQRRRAS